MPQRLLICLLFFLSGASALIFELVFCRLLLRALGAGVSASACVFSAFLAGSAIGALVGTAFPDCLSKTGAPLIGKRRSPSSLDFLRAYGRLELAAGISGFLLCSSLNLQVEESIAALMKIFAGDNVIAGNLLRFAVAFSFLLFPFACMGAGFAAVSKFFSSAKKSEFVSLLYGSNTSGAASGSIAGAFFLIPALGLAMTAGLACFADFFVFLLVEINAGLAQSSLEALSDSQADGAFPEKDCKQRDRFVKVMFACVFLSGFLSVVLEIVWTRIFSLLLGNSIYSVGTVLFAVLSSIGLSAFAAHLFRKKKHLIPGTIAFCFLAAGASILGVCYLQMHGISLVDGIIFWVSGWAFIDEFGRALISRLLLTFAFVFFPFFFLGAVLPLACMRCPSEDASAGKFYGVNCLGAVVAGLFFALFLFPVFTSSMDSSLLFSLLCVALFSLFISASLFICLLLPPDRSLLQPESQAVELWNKRFSSAACGRFLFFIGAGAAFILSLIALRRPPLWEANAMSSGSFVYSSAMPTKSRIAEKEASLLFYHEGINSTVSVSSLTGQNNVCIKSDGKVECTLPIDPSLISPGSDISTHILMGGLPLLFHDGTAARALLIGLGSGLSASTLLSFPELESVVVSELEPSMYTACRLMSRFNADILDNKSLASGRLKVRFQDARFLLASSKDSYDLIVSQPADPWVSGCGDLFTEEFFRLASSRLNRNGLFCQWVQLYAIAPRELAAVIKTFRSVFPRVYICHAPGAGELIIIGCRPGADKVIENPESLVSPEKTKKSGQESSDRFCNRFLQRAGVFDGFDALSLIVCGPDAVAGFAAGDAPNNRDDNPHLEYETCRAALSGSSELSSNFEFLKKSFYGNNFFLPCFRERAGEFDASMALSYFSLYLQDGTQLSALDRVRALEEAERACNYRRGPLGFYTRALLLGALGELKRAEGDLAAASRLKPFDDADRAAIFDMNFQTSNSEKSAYLMQLMAGESASFRLRRGLCLLSSGRAPESYALLDKLRIENPYFLPAVLSSAYAALSSNKVEEAQSLFYDYLSINPWDFNTQLAYLSLLCRIDRKPADAGSLRAIFHRAAVIGMLRTEDPSAFILLLNAALRARDFEIVDKCLQSIKNKESANALARRVLEIYERAGNAEQLQGNQDFIEIVHKLTLKAEDPKIGYKILGEPWFF